MHGVLAKLGVPVTCTDISAPGDRRGWTSLALPQPYAGKVASLRQLIAGWTPRSACWTGSPPSCCPDHDGYRAIQALPGIGRVLGAVIVAEIGDITRFPHPARLCSWAGLTPPPPRVRHQGQPRPHHQAGIADTCAGR